MNTEAEFGAFLRELRTSKDMTLRKLAQISDVSYSYLAHVETGRRGVPSPEIISKIATALNVHESILMLKSGHLKYQYSYQMPLYESDSVLEENEQALFVIGRNLTYIREELEITQEQAAVELKIDYNDYINIENGKRDINAETITKITNYFNVIFSDLIYDLSRLKAIDLQTFINLSKLRELKKKLLESSSEMINSILSKPNTKNSEVREMLNFMYQDSVVQIPIYGEIKAGYDFVAEQNIVGYKLASKSEVSDGDHFYLIVKGDSMIDEGIHEGYHVLVKKQNYVSNGKIGVVIVNGDEATLKRVFYDGDNIVLQASNRNIPPRILPINEVLIQGQVKSVVFDV